MKKVYSTLLLASVASLMFFQVAMAQTEFAKQVTNLKATVHKKLPANTTQGTDTVLFPPSFNQPCGSSLLYYFFQPNSADTGYFSGNNALQSTSGTFYFHTTELGQRYNFSGTGVLTDVYVDFGLATGVSGVTTAKVYNVNSVTQKPSSLIATSSNTLTTSDIQTNISNSDINDYMFSTPVPLPSRFIVTIVLPNPVNGDTAVILSTDETCNSADSAGMFKLDHAGGWNYYKGFMSYNNAGDTTIDLGIYPVITVSGVGVTDYPATKGLTFKGNYPNPARDYTNINYSIDKPTTVSIKIFDVHSKVYKNYTENLASGDHQLNVDVKDLPAGNYFYTIKAGEGVITSKFSVVK